MPSVCKKSDPTPFFRYNQPHRVSLRCPCRSVLCAQHYSFNLHARSCLASALVLPGSEKRAGRLNSIGLVEYNLTNNHLESNDSGTITTG